MIDNVEYLTTMIDAWCCRLKDCALSFVDDYRHGGFSKIQRELKNEDRGSSKRRLNLKFVTNSVRFLLQIGESVVPDDEDWRVRIYGGGEKSLLRFSPSLFVLTFLLCFFLVPVDEEW
ncbi:uncharacterized protein LOC131606569 [Vicia villosa]|uniref:uncharacterized protein LOC131606569 n=1 Tax=Vicia villosa TaxID=3911 RepID=UPI00273B0C63|nr:uncharacterized protein LOC131606569 [Vicia villosa]